MIFRKPHRIAVIVIAAILLAAASCSRHEYLRKNDLLMADGRLAEAEANYRALIAEDPEEGELHYQLARVLLAAGSPAAAMASINRAIIIDPLLDRYQLLAGKIRYAEKNYFDAIEHLTNAVTLNPQLLEAYYYLGSAFRKSGQNDKALEQLQTALSLEPLYFDAHLGWTQVRFEQLVKTASTAGGGQPPETVEKDFKALAETFESALAIEPGSVPGNLLLADIYTTLGADFRAISLLRKRIDDFGSDDRILMALAELEYRRGRFETSRQLLSKLQAGDQLPAQLLRLRIALRSGTSSENDGLERLLVQHPGSAELQLLAAQYALEQGNPGRAERLIQKCLELSPDYAEAYFTLSRVHAALDDLSGAEWTLKKALQLAPGNLEIRLAWLHCLLEQGNWYEAEKQLAYFALDRQHPEVMYILGVIAAEKGDDKTAEQLLEEVARVQYAARVEIRLAEIDTRSARYRQAENRLRRADEFFPRNLEVALAWAELLLQTDRAAQIPALLDPYLPAKNGRGRVHLALAEALLQAGEIPSALKTLQQAVQRWPRNPDLVQAYTLHLGLSNRHAEAVPLLEEMQRIHHKFSRLFYFRLREFYFLSGDKNRFKNYHRFYRLEKNRVRQLP